MFWTEDGRGKKEKGKEKSVVTWMDEKNYHQFLSILLLYYYQFLSQYFYNTFTINLKW